MAPKGNITFLGVFLEFTNANAGVSDCSKEIANANASDCCKELQNAVIVVNLPGLHSLL